MITVADWMDDVSGTDFIWYVKRLSGNDTLANKSHQAGPYIPKQVMFRLFPVLNNPNKKNPDVWFDLYVDSHSDFKDVRAVWYNNKLYGGTRDETRFTNFGGQSSALLDPENTGAIAIFAFLMKNNSATECHVWVCEHETEEYLVEERIGPIEPSDWLVWQTESDFGNIKPKRNCWLDEGEIPVAWLQNYPPGSEILDMSVTRIPSMGLTPDIRLIKRRKCEYEIFRSLEEAVELPSVIQGFPDIDTFIAKAQSILQRRKSRSGNSLEYHARTIFIEEGLVEGADFSYQPESELGKRPDFLFPSEQAYKIAGKRRELMMLACKTTCKDRWRQVLNEADKIETKHLLTLQEGVSENQFREMRKAGVHLVVPSPLLTSYPKSIQPYLLTFESFIGDVRVLV